MSVQNGFQFLHRINCNAYNEGEDLIAQAVKYTQDNGCYPERFCADHIYITTKNSHFCTQVGIQISPSQTISSSAPIKAHAMKWRVPLAQVSANIRKLIMARLTSGAEGTISMAILVMCAEKI